MLRIRSFYNIRNTKHESGSLAKGEERREGRERREGVRSRGWERLSSHASRFTFHVPFALCLLLLFTGIAHTMPITWEDDFGSELSQLTGQDDHVEQATLSFELNVLSMTYTDISVSTNGFITLGTEGEMPYNPDSTALMNASAPVIAPFWSDMDLTETGTVFFNDFGDRAAITWSAIGSFFDPLAAFTFQLQLFEDGRIMFGYDGIPDITTTLDENLVVGVHLGADSTGERGTNYTDHALSHDAYQTTLSGSTYEVFEEGSQPFDLGGENLLFTPLAPPAPVFTVARRPAPPPIDISFSSLPPPEPSQSDPVPEPGSIILLVAGLVGMAVLSRRRKK